MKKVISKNIIQNQNSSSPRLCVFSLLDFIVLASTLSVALGNALSSDDVGILATFFAVLSDELALIEAVSDFSSFEDDDSFTPPTPDVAITRNKISKKRFKNNSYKKKIIKKRINEKTLN